MNRIVAGFTCYPSLITRNFFTKDEGLLCMLIKELNDGTQLVALISNIRHPKGGVLL